MQKIRTVRKIKLIGKLEYYADEVNLAVSNLDDLVCAIKACYPDAEDVLRSTNQMCIGCQTGDDIVWITRDEALLHIPECDKLYVGVDFDGSSGVEVGAMLVQAAIGFAVSWAIGRVVSIFFTDKPKSSDTNQQDSYLLNGPQNSTRSGGAKPLAFGRFRCGSTIISNSMTSERIGTAIRDEFAFDGVGTFTANLFTNDSYSTALSLPSIKIADGYNGVKYTYAVPFTNLTLTNGKTVSVNPNGVITIVRTSATVDDALNIEYTANGSTSAGVYESSANCVVFLNRTYDYSLSGGEGPSSGNGESSGNGGGGGGDAAGEGSGTA